MTYFQWHVIFLAETLDLSNTVQNQLGCSRTSVLPHLPHEELSMPEHFYISLREKEM